MNKGNICKKHGHTCYIGDHINIRREKKGWWEACKVGNKNYIAGSLPRSLVIPRAIQIRSRTKVWSMTQLYNYDNHMTYFLS